MPFINRGVGGVYAPYYPRLPLVCVNEVGAIVVGEFVDDSGQFADAGEVLLAEGVEHLREVLGALLADTLQLALRAGPLSLSRAMIDNCGPVRSDCSAMRKYMTYSLVIAGRIRAAMSSGVDGVMVSIVDTFAPETDTPGEPD